MAIWTKITDPTTSHTSRRLPRCSLFGVNIDPRYNILMPLTLVVQAGGESRRMGQNKALAPFLGEPLIARVLARVGGLADEILVTSNTPADLAFLGLPVLPDVIPGQGALGGLLTALTAAHHELVAVVACDMPFASPALLAAERETVETLGVDGCVPQSAEGFEPFHAVYRRETCRWAVEKALIAGEKRLISWFGDMRLVFYTPEQVARCDPSGAAFINVNSPEELRAAEALASGDQPLNAVSG
jgi:molybdenum cofactor guanylyltransferase